MSFMRGYRSGVLGVYVAPLCWALFGIGHAASLACNALDRDEDYDPNTEPGWPFRVAFRTYQSTMAWSYRIQAWAEGGVYCRWLPWGPPETHTKGRSND